MFSSVPIYFSCLTECSKVVLQWSSRNVLWHIKYHLTFHQHGRWVDNDYIFIFGCTYSSSFTCATSLDWSLVWNWAAVTKKKKIMKDLVHKLSHGRPTEFWWMQKGSLNILWSLITQHTRRRERNSKVDDFSAKASVLFIPKKPMILQ